jgi:TM2 domain-containing membrane protein YozV
VLAFILGFIPGLGAIYNGEYNKAMIHIVVFGALILGITGAFGEGMDGFWVFGLVYGEGPPDRRGPERSN